MAGAAHGGAEMAFVDMCLAMKDAGQDVMAVTRSNNLRVPMLEKQGIPVKQLPFGGMLDVWTRHSMTSVIKSFQPHIVQTWMSRAAQKTPRWSASMGIPRYMVFSRLGGYYKLKNYRQTDYFITITPDIRRYLIDQNIALDRVRHINNFAETEAADTPASRADENTPDDAKLILCLGRLHPSKAFDTMMRAIVPIPDVHLWIAGEGPQRADLEYLRHDLGLDNRVRFLGWRDDRAALLQAADLCVFPSRYEPFGTVFVQAWAQKTPVICTAADGPRQYIRNGEDGILVPVDNVTELSEAISKTLGDSALREKMVGNGYARYLAEFTKDRAVAQYLDFYREILARTANIDTENRVVV